jgi:hypothetical protein
MSAIRGTGVHLRLADAAEARAVAAATSRRPVALDLDPPRSVVLDVASPRSPGPGEVLVVSQAFAEVLGFAERVVGPEHHGASVPADGDATLALLEIATRTADDLLDLVASLRIAGLAVGRWDVFSAPRRFELAEDLAARLAPLRRG